MAGDGLTGFISEVIIKKIVNRDAANLHRGRKATMVTLHERTTSAQIDRRTGLLSEWVEQDMTDILTEFGARMEDAAPERVRRIPAAQPGLRRADGRGALLYLRAGGGLAAGSSGSGRLRLRGRLLGRPRFLLVISCLPADTLRTQRCRETAAISGRAQAAQLWRAGDTGAGRTLASAVPIRPRTRRMGAVPPSG